MKQVEDPRKSQSKSAKVRIVAGLLTGITGLIFTFLSQDMLFIEKSTRLYLQNFSVFMFGIGFVIAFTSNRRRRSFKELYETDAANPLQGNEPVSAKSTASQKPDRDTIPLSEMTKKIRK